MPDLCTSEHEDFRQDRPHLLRARGRPPPRRSGRRTASCRREVWLKAGEAGLLCFDVAEEYGGAGVDDFRYNVILAEEQTRAGASGPGFSVHTDIIVPYLTSLGDRRAEAALAARLRQRRDHHRDRDDRAGRRAATCRASAPPPSTRATTTSSTAPRPSSPTASTADLVIVVARTDPEAGHKGISLLVVERGMEGFERGRNLDKIGLHAQDTAELFFDRRRRAQGEPPRRGGRGLHLPDDEPPPGAADRSPPQAVAACRGDRRDVPRLRQGRARRSASRSASSSTTGS